MLGADVTEIPRQSTVRCEVFGEALGLPALQIPSLVEDGLYPRIDFPPNNTPICLIQIVQQCLLSCLPHHIHKGSRKVCLETPRSLDGYSTCAQQ